MKLQNAKNGFWAIPVVFAINFQSRNGYFSTPVIWLIEFFIFQEFCSLRTANY